MPAIPKLTNEEIADILLSRYLTNLFFFESVQSYFTYDNGYFTTLPLESLHGMIHGYLREAKGSEEFYATMSSLNITSNLVKDIAQQLIWMLPIKQRKNEIDFSQIVFADVTYDAKTDSTHEHRESDNAVIHYDFPYSEDANNPQQFIDFLYTAFEGDEELIDFLQLTFGYLLAGNNLAQLSFFLIGEGGSGKSVLLDVMRGLFPRETSTSVSLADLTNSQFRSSSLIGKHFNFVSEQAPKFQSSEQFKRIVTGDTMLVERKYQLPFDYSPNIVLVSAVNQLPVFDRTDHAISRRLAFIPMNHIVSDEQKNIHLPQQILQKEKQEIIAWAIKGLRKLKALHFIFPQTKKMLALNMEQKSQTSSAVHFFSECCEKTEDATDIVAKKQIFTVYKAWCIDEGRMPVSRSRFFDDIKSAYRVTIDDRVWISATRAYVASVVGVRFNETAIKDYVRVV